MSDMVRKQIYITRRQEMLLKRLARLRGVSEAEIFRKALEKEMVAPITVEAEQRDSQKALEELLQLALSRQKLCHRAENHIAGIVKKSTKNVNEDGRSVIERSET